MARHRKQMLRNEHRRNHRLAPRREIGRTPNWVYLERWNRLRSVGVELDLMTEEDEA